ncbi:MAG: hypothetical protein PHY12_08615, partial [Eubacteriales bacterium]|nr:hypothetical protein [Eubacteriales bacterium]
MKQPSAANYLMEAIVKKRRTNWIFCAVMLVFCGLLCLIPDTRLNATASIPREQARIESVDNSALYPVGIVYSGVQNCQVTVLTGEFAGQ